MQAIEASSNVHRQTFTFYPTKLADYVFIGKDAIVEAVAIGHGVEIGEGAVIVSFNIDQHQASVTPSDACRGHSSRSKISWLSDQGQ